MKSRKSILLVCAGGNSTSLMVESMKAHLMPDEDWTIEANASSELTHIIGKYDYVLVAPQMMFQFEQIKSLAAEFDGIEVMSIPADIYARMNGSAINDMIRSSFQNPEENLDEGDKKMSETKSSNFMEKLTDWMNKYLVPVGQRISNQRHLAAVKDGLAVLIPVSIIGGFAILLAIPPVPATVTEGTNFFYSFLLAWKAWAAANYSILITPYSLTIGIISVYVVCGIAYRLATNYGMNGLTNMIGALLVFLVVSGALDLETSTLAVGRLGAGYMFGAIIIALLVVEITRMFDKYNIKIKLPDSVPPNVAAPFNVLIALVFNVVLFSIVNALLMKFTGGGITDLIYTIFTPLMRASGSLPSILILTFLSSLFWFFGIHGDNMMSAVVTPITTAALAANAEAVAAGTAMPYIYAGTMGAVFGGWIIGNNAMNLLLLLTAKSSRTRSLTKVAAVPALFNIAEPYVFGFPEVLNVYYFVPAVINQVINITTYYFLASAGIVGRFYISLPFTTPAPLQALLCTGGNVPTMLLSLVLIVINMLIFYPFLRVYDKQLIKEEEEGKA